MRSAAFTAATDPVTISKTRLCPSREARRRLGCLLCCFTTCHATTAHAHRAAAFTETERDSITGDGRGEGSAVGSAEGAGLGVLVGAGETLTRDYFLGVPSNAKSIFM